MKRNQAEKAWKAFWQIIEGEDRLMPSTRDVRSINDRGNQFDYRANEEQLYLNCSSRWAGAVLDMLLKIHGRRRRQPFSFSVTRMGVGRVFFEEQTEA